MSNNETGEMSTNSTPNVSRNRYLICTDAEATTCAKCRSAVWVAMVDGFRVEVDPTPLDATAEIFLRMQGVRIYQTCAVVGRRFQLQKRTAWHITKGDAKAVALAGHDCARGVAEIVEIFPELKPKEADF